MVMVLVKVIYTLKYWRKQVPARVIGTGYGLKTVKYGKDAKFSITMNNLNYVRTCDYKRTICTGAGTVACAPHFNAYNCTPWELVK